MRNGLGEFDLGEVGLDAVGRPPSPRRWPLALAGLGVVWAAIALTSDGGDGRREPARPPVERIEVVEPATAISIHIRRDLDDRILVGLPLGEDRGILAELDLGTGDITRATVDGERWPDDLDEPTTEPDYPDADAAARSPDGLHVAVFTRSQTNRETGIAIYTEGASARRFHHLLSVAELVSRRLVWSPDSVAVYFLAASAEGSADRLIGIPLNGSAQTVATFAERGFYGVAAAAQPATG